MPPLKPGARGFALKPPKRMRGKRPACPAFGLPIDLTEEEPYWNFRKFRVGVSGVSGHFFLVAFLVAFPVAFPAAFPGGVSRGVSGGVSGYICGYDYEL